MAVRVESGKLRVSVAELVREVEERKIEAEEYQIQVERRVQVMADELVEVRIRREKEEEIWEEERKEGERRVEEIRAEMEGRIAEKEEEERVIVGKFEEEKAVMLTEKKRELSDMLVKVQALHNSHQTMMDTRNLKVKQLELEVEKLTNSCILLQKDNRELTVTKQGQIEELVEQVGKFEEMLLQAGDGETGDKEGPRVKVQELEKARKEQRETMSEMAKKKDEKIGKLREQVKELGEELANSRSQVVMQEEEMKILAKEQAEGLVEVEINDGVASMQLQEAEGRLKEAMDMVEGREKVVTELLEKLGNKEREVEALGKHMEIMDRKMRILREKGARGDNDGEIEELKREVKELRMKCEEHDQKIEVTVSTEREGWVKERGEKVRETRKLEELLEDMRGTNLDLVEELEGLRRGAEGAYESPMKSSKPAMTVGISPEKKNAMSPVMNESLAKKHADVVKRLQGMKNVIKGELTPVKRRKVGGVSGAGVGMKRAGGGHHAAASNTGERAKILSNMERQIELLLRELEGAKDALIGKDELLVEMGEVIERFEKDRVGREEEFEEMEGYVERCGKVVEKELEWRKRSEEEFELVKVEVELLRRETSNQQVVIKRQGDVNDAVGGIVRRGEAEWVEKFESAQIVSRAIAILFGGMMKCRDARRFDLGEAWKRWREVMLDWNVKHVLVRYEAVVDELEGERRLNSDLMLASATTAKASEERIMVLEEEVGGLRNEVGKRDQAVKMSREIVDKSRAVREELMEGVRGVKFGCLVRGLIGGWKRRAVVRAFGFWRGVVGEARMKEEVKGIQNQLEGTKGKLLQLKGALREGGWLPKGGTEEGGGRTEDSFDWDLSSDDGTVA